MISNKSIEIMQFKLKIKHSIKTFINFIEIFLVTDLIGTILYFVLLTIKLSPMNTD